MNISTLDLSVILCYLVGIFLVAYFSSRKSGELGSSIEEEQYLAGKSLTFSESICSIIATEVSALTFLGIPAYSYGKDFSFVQIYIGAIFGRYIIARIILPLIYDQGLTIYSVMGKNGTIGGQRLTACGYFFSKCLAVGVRLFSGSILVSEFFNLSIYWSVFLICIITFFYTLVGGLKAVVRTDMAQMFLFIGGGIVAHYMIADVDGRSWLEMMSVASSAGKTMFLNPNNLNEFFIGVVGGILFDIATHGMDQDFIQRLTANSSLKAGRWAIVLSSFVSISVGMLFLGIGALLWSHYQVITPPNVSNDQLFAYFITNYFPDGIKGLMIAGVLAATMSTLDSTINALSATLFSDILRHNTSDQKKVSFLYSLDTFIITTIIMLVAFAASSSDQLLLLGLKVVSWTGGSLVCLFFGAVYFKKHSIKLDSINVLGVYAFGVAGVYLNNNILAWPWQWNMYFAVFFGSIFLIARKALRAK